VDLLLFGPATLVLTRRVYDAIFDLSSLSGWEAMHAMHLDAFQLLAWGVAFYLLGRLSPGRAPNRYEIAGAIMVCLIGAFSSAAGLAALSLYLFAMAAGDGRQHAVATVFAALFGQQAVVPLIYGLVVDKLTRFDAMLVGTAVKLSDAGATWQGNIIALPSGHAIQILEACCSFHNVSMAVLSWVAVTKLERPQWRPGDIAVLAAAAGCQVLMNAVRIYLMAQSFDMYDYWHNGAGARIYSVSASAAAVLIVAYGAHLVSRGAANRAMVASLA
jgi:hypothetical protein